MSAKCAANHMVWQTLIHEYNIYIVVKNEFFTGNAESLPIDGLHVKLEKE
jgi:hypothetical protein